MEFLSGIQPGIEGIALWIHVGLFLVQLGILICGMVFLINYYRKFRAKSLNEPLANEPLRLEQKLKKLHEEAKEALRVEKAKSEMMNQALQAEKAKAEVSEQAKEAFLQNMRHDIRTPLTGIVGFSDLLKQERDETKIQFYTTGLAESSRELLRFLNEVLESIEVASGEIPIVKKQFSVRETLENKVPLAEALYEKYFSPPPVQADIAENTHLYIDIVSNTNLQSDISTNTHWQADIPGNTYCHFKS